MKRKVAIDSGKYQTKAITRLADSELKRIIFRTKMDETTETKSSASGTYVIEFNGEKLLLGEQAETVDFDTNKAKKLHKIATYACVAQLVDNGDEVEITIGCPMSIFLNTKSRSEYQAFMMGDKTVKISVNEEEKVFTITKVNICPESAGVVFKNADKYKDKLIGVVDIGGLNINACIFDTLNFIKSTAFTVNEGANRFSSDLRILLNEKFGSNIQDFQMQHIVGDGFIRSNKEKSAVEISNFSQSHINKKVVVEAKKKNWDLENMDLIFIGGGSLLLEKEIKKAISHAEVSKNAVWDNVEGFAVLGGI